MKEKILNYLKNTFIAFDQLLNVIFLNGYPDETLSSRFYRWHRDGIYKHPMIILDKILFFDKSHCYESYESERLRRQLPPEFRIEIYNK